MIGFYHIIQDTLHHKLSTYKLPKVADENVAAVVRDDLTENVFFHQTNKEPVVYTPKKTTMDHSKRRDTCAMCA